MEHIASDEPGMNTLGGFLRCRPLDLSQSLRWAIQFCHGMEYACSKGVKAHRDIKPTNIWSLYERENNIDENIFIKLVLPATVSNKECTKWLEEKGITKSFLFPDEIIKE
jgi:serine/threonine protein kinase